MKKLLSILVLGLLLSGSAYSKEINLKCIDIENASLESPLTDKEIRVIFNKKIVEINDGKNLLEFKVRSYEQDMVLTKWRGLEKGNTTYNTHVTDWKKWDHIGYKDHLYQIAINRLDGELYQVRSTEPVTSKSMIVDFSKYKIELVLAYKCKIHEQKF
jgi:hypothetical protein